MEIHEIQLGEHKVYYQLYIKQNNKRCYLRIKEGKLIVSASPYFSKRDIDTFIRKNKNYIIQHISQYQPKALYEDGGYMYIFNIKYQIVLRDRNKKQCNIDGKYLYVYHVNMQEVIENYAKGILLAYIIEYITNKQSVISTMPEITIRKMKSRWGSCFTTRNKVSFNLALIHLDRELIDYVILHELCHFLQANHSPLFYQEIEKYMPDYKQRIKRLKEVSI